ncbi:hypothetical protein DPMN_194364 [Dreissena polymorpha]|uniref:Uncharacterized protein n=1 Tax=Dreissena polymorpha TaxID=45954 RepID=A0A9D4B7W2_DREPO|nr:hypothetical protein DPMN_194364 [Dreissena polymorpha]
MKRSATEAFIEPKVPIRDKIPRSFTRSVNTTDITPTEVESPSDLDLEHAEESDLDPIIPGVEDKQSLKNVQGLGEQTGMLITEQDLTSNNSNNSASDTVISKDHSGSRRVERAMVRDFMRSAGPGSEVRRLTFEKEGMDFQLEKLPTRRPGKLPTKLAKNLELNQKYTRKEPPVRQILQLDKMYNV